MRIHPVRLLETGYQFQFPELEPALRHTLNRPEHG
jgi:NAD dependent epimerase/dehydratase family enzyme